MTEQTAAPPSGRPIPVTDEASQPFFDATRQGKYLLKYCATCKRHLAPQAEVCDSCFGNELEWREASGKGTVYSFVINHQVLHPGFKDLGPYSVIVVELEEGPRITSTYDGPNEEIEVDMAVKVTFEDLGEVTVPKFARV
jgi:uncharacterized OB-fold protein